MKTEELKAVADVLHELGLSYQETLNLLSGVTMESRFVRRLWREGYKPWLIKLGLALIIFPEPVVSDILGTLMLSFGIIQTKMKRSTMQLEDVYNTFRGAVKELQTIRRELST